MSHWMQRNEEEEKREWKLISLALEAVKPLRVPSQFVHGVIKCPACGGKLHFYQSAHNGHGRGVCEKQDCMGWME